MSAFQFFSFCLDGFQLSALTLAFSLQPLFQRRLNDPKLGVAPNGEKGIAPRPKPGKLGLCQ
jgi:hypothetical protein